MNTEDAEKEPEIPDFHNLTSPSQLQEVTLDPDATNFSYMGMRSPGAMTCGRSVKEYEEQLTNLRKENFNLKLRIYFLEERLGSNFNTEKETAIKKNIELMVELENTRKELLDKQELLYQAAKAMEIEESERQKDVEIRDSQIEELKSQLRTLRNKFEDAQTELQLHEEGRQLDLCREAFNLNVSDSNNISVELQATIKDLQTQLSEEKTRSEHLQKLMEFERKRHKNCTVEIHAKESEIDNLTLKLEESNRALSDTVTKFEKLQTDFRTCCGKLMEKNTEIEAKVNELEELKADLRSRSSGDERRTEKHNRRSSKIAELENYIEKQQYKIKLLESQLSSAFEEKMKKMAKCETVSCGTDVPPSPTDNELFSVQNSATVSSKQDTSKLSPSRQSANSSVTEELQHAKEEVVRLKAEQHKACQIIHSMIAARKRDTQEMERLQRLVGEKDKSGTSGTQHTSNFEPSMNKDELQLLDQYKILTNELENKTQVLTDMLKEKDVQIELIQKREEKLALDLQAQSNKVIDLEFELLSMSKLEISDDEREADRELQIKFEKRTCDLQGIINKELWEKNRTIEKMHRVMEMRDSEIVQLKKEIEGKNAQFSILKGKIDELEYEGDDSNRCEKCDNFEKALEVCSVLSTRLEELCHFLNSLLRQKIVLGLLSNEQAQKMQEIIDRSIDLSHNVSQIGDKSLLQLSNISNLLSATRNDTSIIKDLMNIDNDTSFSIIPSDVTLTYQNHLNLSVTKYLDNPQDVIEKQAQVIKVLRNQIADLKREIDLRDNELARTIQESKSQKMLQNDAEFVDAVMDVMDVSSTVVKTPNTIMKQLRNDSESESWSEPDRTVSLARIGLMDETLKRPKRSKFTTNSTASESTEEEEGEKRSPSKRSTLHETRQTIVGLHEQVCELEFRLKEKEGELLTNQVAFYKIDNKLKEEQIRNRELEEIIRSTESRLQETKKNLEVAEDEVGRLRRLVEDLEAFKTDIENRMVNKDKELQNRLNELQIEKDRALAAAENAEEHLRRSLEEKMCVEDELKNMIIIKKDMENQLCMEVKKIEMECEKQSADFKSRIEEIKEMYERDYVKKFEVERQTIEIGEITGQVVQLQSVVRECEDKMHEMQTKELELRLQMQALQREHNEKLNGVQKQLDNATLRYSEVTLEKTKLANENARLEQQVRRNHVREVELIKQVSDLKKEFTNLKNNFQHHYSQQEEQKSKLQSRVDELVTNNTDLYNHLAKIQTASSSKVDNVYLALPSPSDNEHEPIDGNSSPDLGIESDQGRFSSLEANCNIPRPLLCTLELTESMSNMLDNVQDISCGNEHCCKVTKKMAEENRELRKNLLQTRRELEHSVKHLKLANQRKREVERNICRQIHKTSQVLRKAKANLGSGSDSDILK